MLKHTSAARSRLTHKRCPHCGKNVNLKTFKEHRRLYYDSDKRTWTKHEGTSQGPISSASLLEELELIDMDMDLMVSDGEDTPDDWTDDDEDEPPVSAAQTQALHMNPPEMVTPDINEGLL